MAEFKKREGAKRADRADALTGIRVGQTLPNGWSVVQKYGPERCGRYSTGYRVQHVDGRFGFLKALDYDFYLLSDDPSERLRAALDAYSDESRLLRIADRFRLDRIVKLYDGATLRAADHRATVSYLIFELADSDGRSQLDATVRNDYLDAAIVTREEAGGIHIAELAAAVATLELKNGNLARAKKIFRISMAAPTDNALAQVVWANERKSLSLTFDRNKLDGILTSEAVARDAFAKQDWSACHVALLRWISDQPFCSDPTVVGSYIAGELIDDPSLALTYTCIGLKNNPHISMLYNNQAVAYAKLGKIHEAEIAARKSHTYSDKQNNYEQIFIQATRGLIEYRKRNLEEGEKFYRTALELANTAKSRPYVARVLLYLVQERVIYDPECIELADEWLRPLDEYKGDKLFDAVQSVVRRKIELAAKLRPRDTLFGGGTFINSELRNLAEFGSRLLSVT